MGIILIGVAHFPDDKPSINYLKNYETRLFRQLIPNERGSAQSGLGYRLSQQHNISFGLDSVCVASRHAACFGACPPPSYVQPDRKTKVTFRVRASSRAGRLRFRWVRSVLFATLDLLLLRRTLLEGKTGGRRTKTTASLSEFWVGGAVGGYVKSSRTVYLSAGLSSVSGMQKSKIYTAIFNRAMIKVNRRIYDKISLIKLLDTFMLRYGVKFFRTSRFAC